MTLEQKIKQGNLSRRDFLNLMGRVAVAGAGAVIVPSIVGGGCKDKRPKPTGTGTDTGTGIPTYTTQIKVKDIYAETDTPVEDILVTLDGKSAYTDANGVAEIELDTDGLFDVTIENTGYHTYNFQADLSEAQPTAEEYIVSEDTNLDSHYGNLFNTDGVPFPSLNITGQLQKPDFDLMQIYIDTTNAPDQNAIDQTISIYENEMPILTDSNFNALRSNGRITIGTNPPALGTDNLFYFSWQSGAGHNEYLNSADPNLITAANSNVWPTSLIGVYREEICQPMGARSDSDYPNTLLENSIPSGLTDFSIEDRLVFRRAMRRPIGSGLS